MWTSRSSSAPIATLYPAINPTASVQNSGRSLSVRYAGCLSEIYFGVTLLQMTDDTES